MTVDHDLPTDPDTPLWVWWDVCLERPEVVPPAIYAPAIYAETHGLPLTRTLDLGDGATIDFTLIPPGHARLGERCEIEFQVTQPYWISTTPVTQLQYAAVTGQRPSRFSGGGDRPVERVSWRDAVEFCKKTGTTLPREWQWEYACRAWSTARYHWGDQWSKKLANCEGAETTAVGSYPANPWGLYDMHGNVWEWCLDNYTDQLLIPSEGEQRSPFVVFVAAPGSPTPGTVVRPSAAATMPATATRTAVFASSSEDEQSGPFALCVAGPGTTSPVAVVRPSATASMPTTAASTVFASSSEGEQSGPFVVFVAAPGTPKPGTVVRPTAAGTMPTSATTSSASASSSEGEQSGPFPRCLRGGSWTLNARYCRSAYRLSHDAGYRIYNCGFRVLLPLD